MNSFVDGLSRELTRCTAGQNRVPRYVPNSANMTSANPVPRRALGADAT